ncbi:tRNA (N(6)-L-threonylcarbamoyladenosine(37)-C(2))-methylthiotransferase MtaB [Oscillospiraceae bacterium OttesenSCG-928-G22]|nr:tRNA (N(6)-L-threonylcarbamoyladenosine(37)-C(2))-methylthiotransferase MtaB [Oscillospiraceae bacterium OttesenSCG-928-G22]
MNISFLTLGCKVNQYETEELMARLRAAGHALAESAAKADAFVINTCAVTAESVRKSKQAIRRLRREHPGALFAVLGCFPEAEPETAASLGADFVRGTGKLDEALAFFSAAGESERADEAKLPPPSGGRTRALLKVQDGCDNFCTYCIIPHLKGRSRSVPIREAEERASALYRQGYREIVLVGIELSSYGPDVGSDLAELIVAVAAAAPGVRLRLGSLEPRTVSEAFLEKIAKLPAICPHFHLSLQAGCDETLSRMGRRYTTAEYAEALSRVRSYFPEAAITTDVICGFPGESEEDFETTLRFCRDCGFSDMHIFPYSRREGTPANDFPRQCSKEEKQRRAARLQDVRDEGRRAYLERQIGRTLQVLFERGRGNLSTGHSENYLNVDVNAAVPRGTVRSVRITGADGTRLVGELAPDETGETSAGEVGG